MSEKKPKKEKIPKPPKEKPSEGELVKKYVNRVIKNQVFTIYINL
jgi:hypothetical protein